MFIINTIHVIYVAVISCLVLLSPFLGGANPSVNYLFHYLLGLLGLLAAVFYFLKSRFFSWLLLFWWTPQVLQIVIAQTPPTYLMHQIIPVYHVSLGPHVTVFLRYDIGPDEYRLIRFSIVAILGLILSIISIYKNKRIEQLVSVSTEENHDIIKRSHLAVSSFILGILNLPLYGFMTLPCVICGHMACRKIKKPENKLKGKGLAVSGLIMGYLGIVIFLGATYVSNLCNHYKPYTLPSGKVIKLMRVNKWIEAGEENSLVLEYETDIDLDSKDELKTEAEHIWNYFKINVEEAGLTKARILAYSPKKGKFITKSSGYGFLITKQFDGSWQFREENEAEPKNIESP